MKYLINAIFLVTAYTCWFEGCPPCRAEFPAFKDLYKRRKDNKDLVFLTATYESPVTVERIKKSTRYSVP